MVQLIPSEPTFTTASEQQVWEQLRGGLGDDDALIANLRLTDEVRDYEADLVVLMPEFGALVLEVKGSSVWYDEGWIQKVAGESQWIHPVDHVPREPSLDKPTNDLRHGGSSAESVTAEPFTLHTEARGERT